MLPLRTSWYSLLAVGVIQHAHFAVQILRLGMLRAQGFDFDLHPSFGDG
jgi:hypothetical protein